MALDSVGVDKNGCVLSTNEERGTSHDANGSTQEGSWARNNCARSKRYEWRGRRRYSGVAQRQEKAENCSQ